jgi:hypothetical protein
LLNVLAQIAKQNHFSASAGTILCGGGSSGNVSIKSSKINSSSNRSSSNSNCNISSYDHIVICLPFSHLTSPSETDSANGGTVTILISSPVKYKQLKKRKSYYIAYTQNPT